MEKSWINRIILGALFIAACGGLTPLWEGVKLDGQEPYFSPAWIFFGYAVGLALLAIGAPRLMIKKHPPFVPWVRAASIVLFWNGGAISVSGRALSFRNPPVGELLGATFYDRQMIGKLLSWAIIAACLYLVFGGDRTDKTSDQGANENRIKWMRLCGVAFIAEALFHETFVMATAPWKEPFTLNTSFFVLGLIAAAVGIGIATALMVYPHKAEKPVP